MLIRVSLVSWFCLSGALVLAADPPLPAAGSKAAEFAKINKEWTDLIANLGALKSEYTTSTDAAKKAEIARQYKKGVAKAESMEGQLISAAEDAFAEAPNADPEIVKLLAITLYEQVERDDYEPAFKLGKLLMDNKCTAHELPALAGVAAYCVNEYDLAGRWLKAAETSGALANLCKMMPKRHYADYLEMLELTKTGWAKEMKIRDGEAKADDLPRVHLKTSAGEIDVELFENEAPNTVLNFITLVDKGFYNGVKFHRVLPGFMAQAGDPKGDGSGGPGFTIPDEQTRSDHRLHFRGSLSMANTGRPNTGGSQFFLTFEPTTYLNGKHAVFGRVIGGIDVLAKLKRRDPEDQTVGPADTIIEAKVIRKRNHAYDAKDVKKSAAGD